MTPVHAAFSRTLVMEGYRRTRARRALMKPWKAPCDGMCVRRFLCTVPGMLRRKCFARPTQFVSLLLLAVKEKTLTAET